MLEQVSTGGRAIYAKDPFEKMMEDIMKGVANIKLFSSGTAAHHLSVRAALGVSHSCGENKLNKEQVQVDAQASTTVVEGSQIVHGGAGFPPGAAPTESLLPQPILVMEVDRDTVLPVWSRCHQEGSDSCSWEKKTLTMGHGAQAGKAEEEHGGGASSTTKGEEQQGKEKKAIWRDDLLTVLEEVAPKKASTAGVERWPLHEVEHFLITWACFRLKKSAQPAAQKAHEAVFANIEEEYVCHPKIRIFARSRRKAGWSVEPSGLLSRIYRGGEKVMPYRREYLLKKRSQIAEHFDFLYKI